MMTFRWITTIITILASWSLIAAESDCERILQSQKQLTLHIKNLKELPTKKISKSFKKIIADEESSNLSFVVTELIVHGKNKSCGMGFLEKNEGVQVWYNNNSLIRSDLFSFSKDDKLTKWQRVSKSGKKETSYFK